LKALEKAATAGDWDKVHEKLHIVMTQTGKFHTAVAGLK